MSTPYVELRGIAKRFANVVACDDVSLDLSRGQVHGLLGENGAGKTTLMNILYGLIQPNSGTIRIGGEPVSIDSPKAAKEQGIGMVHQHFMLVPNMTVAENIALGQGGPRRLRADIEKVESEVHELSERFGLRVEPRTVVEELSVGVQQRVEILKLLYREATVMIFDEPTAVLSPPEWDELKGIFQSLSDAGKAIVLITHKLKELQEAAESCTVMRDGGVIGTVQLSTTDNRELARMMVGRDVVLKAERVEVEPGPTILDVEGLTLSDNRGVKVVDDVRFSVRGGEVLGLAGVDGNGQQELIELLTGMREPDHGTIRLGHTEFSSITPLEFSRYGGGVIPNDRRRTAIALSLSITENLVLKEYMEEGFRRFGLLDLDAMRRHAEQLVSEYGVRTASVEALMSQLSGGNQQKVVLAREMHRQPKLLIAGQPTRGLDVGAMESVYDHLAAHKRRGGATLLVSTELDEILALSDRIGVMLNGRLTGIEHASSVDVEQIGLLMAGAGR